MERTEQIKGDKSSIGQFDAKQRGKKIAGAFLAGKANLADELKNTPAEHQESLKQGIFDVLVSQITLPVVEEDIKRLETAGKGLQIIISGSRLPALFKELTLLFSKYQQEAAQYDYAIRQQYGPKLRQKEEELSRQLGREVRIDPMQDPEFIAFYNQHINALKGGYQGEIDRITGEIRSLFGA
jgi:hypothetical protein